MYYSVLIIGKPGACKTTAHGSVLLECKKNGKNPQFESDRIRLEDRVVVDATGGTIKPDGSVVGAHSILFDGSKPPGRKVFQVTDGLLLNEEHDEMIRIATTHRNPDGVVLEYALGSDIHFPSAPDLPLLQSGESLFRRLERFPVVDNRALIILELEATFDRRMDRNKTRIDGMKPETVQMLFGDGCEFLPFAGRLTHPTITYYRIDNNNDDLHVLLEGLEGFHEQILRPTLERSRMALGIEGTPKLPGVER